MEARSRSSSSCLEGEQIEKGEMVGTASLSESEGASAGASAIKHFQSMDIHQNRLF